MEEAERLYRGDRRCGGGTGRSNQRNFAQRHRGGARNRTRRASNGRAENSRSVKPTSRPRTSIRPRPT
jgi:hypothetical protein